jgi:uncharacterized membrane protein YgcG
MTTQAIIFACTGIAVVLLLFFWRITRRRSRVQDLHDQITGKAPRSSRYLDTIVPAALVATAVKSSQTQADETVPVNNPVNTGDFGANSDSVSASPDSGNSGGGGGDGGGGGGSSGD